MAAAGGELAARQRQMAEGGGGPHVVHCPDHALAAVENAADVVQREHALIDPVQVHDVGFLELSRAGDVAAGTANVEVPQVFPPQTEPPPHRQSLAQEVPLSPPAVAPLAHQQVVGRLVSHQHARLHAVVVQRHQQAVGSQGGASRSLARVHYQYSHAATVGLFFWFC